MCRNASSWVGARMQQPMLIPMIRQRFAELMGGYMGGTLDRSDGYIVASPRTGPYRNPRADPGRTAAGLGRDPGSGLEPERGNSLVPNHADVIRGKPTCQSTWHTPCHPANHTLRARGRGLPDARFPRCPGPGHPVVLLPGLRADHIGRLSPVLPPQMRVRRGNAAKPSGQLRTFDHQFRGRRTPLRRSRLSGCRARGAVISAHRAPRPGYWRLRLDRRQ